MDISITELMRSYGAWVRDDGDNMGCKSPAYQLMRVAPKQCKDMVKPKSKSRPAYISDDLGLAVDNAMGVLMQEYLVIYNILMLKFVNGYSDRDIAKYYVSGIEHPDGKKKVPHTAIKPLVTQGMGFVSGYLVSNKRGDKG